MWQILAIVVGVLFVLMLILGLTFNKTYFQRAINDIESYKERRLDNDQILIMCVKKGRTNLARVILIIVFPLFVLIIALLILTIKITDKPVLEAIANNLVDTIKDEVQNLLEDNTNEEMIVYGDEISVTNNFSIIIPADFKQQGNKYVYDTGLGEYDYCDFSFNNVENYQTAEDLSNELSVHYFGKNESIASEINEIKWLGFTKNTSSLETYYNITEKDNLVYLIEYNIGTEVEKPEICQNYYNEIMNSIYAK